MAAAVEVIYADDQGCSIQWNYDNTLLTVQSLSYQVPSTSTPLIIEYSISGHAVAPQTKQPGTSGNLLLAFSPSVKQAVSPLTGQSFLKFSGIDFIGGGHASG